ncbi:MAG: ATP-binding cassette domain-containing protein [Chloroflexi bacterium]|nr:ATP-binding cassette domain-containing protein [Chloroflexota bacterium]
MIHLSDVRYWYPESELPALDGVSLHVQEGEFVLVAGPSGSGKSTLLRCLNGLVPYFSGGRVAGQVSVFGRDPVAQGPHRMSSVVGFVQQDPEAQFVVETVEDELAFAMENHGVPLPTMRRRVEEALDQLGIAHLRGRRISTLSGGERQRVAIAAVLTLQPRVLVLDEPTSQLDPQAADEVLTLLRHLNLDLGLTVLLSGHRLERVAQYADKLVYLARRGASLLVGEPRQVLPAMEALPPLVELGVRLGWSPLPLTVKEARPWASTLDLRPANGNGQPLETASPLALQADDLWYAYNGTPALQGLSFQARVGEVVALMGRNGAGKTTLLKCLVGLLRPQQGRLQVAGLDARQARPEEIVAHVGYVPQNPSALLFAETVADEIAFTRQARGLPKLEGDSLLALLGLQGQADRYPRDLSVGERQRVALAAVLAGEPSILLLDEPTRGLDGPQKRKLAAFLRTWAKQGHTVVMATHDVELAAECAGRVVILGDGRTVAEGPIRQVMGASLAFATQVNKLLGDPHYLTVGDVLAAVQVTA